MPIDKEKCLVGMKVQDHNGNVGIVRWIGRMEKAQKPPNKDVGTYAAVEYAPNEMEHRTDGTWEGQRYCEAPKGSVEFVKPRALDFEMNTSGIAAVRTKYGATIADWPDLLIIKFLIARKYDMPKVYIMIDDHLKWRAEFQPDPDEYFPPEMADGYPVGYCEDGLDKEGNLIYFERPGNGGKSSPKDFVKQFGLPMIMRWHVANMESGVRRLKQHPTARRVTSVIDLSNLGDSDRSVINFGKGIAKIDQDNYPEHLAKMYIINAPTMFVGLWKLIRMFVDDRTKNKIHIVGKDWPQVIEKQVDRKYWPAFMQGTNDSWLSTGGRVGSNDPSKARDPASGAMKFDEVDDKELAAAAAAPDESPRAATDNVAGDSFANTPSPTA